MEIRSALPFNAIPATVIRGVFPFTFLTLKYCIVSMFYIYHNSLYIFFMWQIC